MQRHVSDCRARPNQKTTGKTIDTGNESSLAKANSPKSQNRRVTCSSEILRHLQGQPHHECRSPAFLRLSRAGSHLGGLRPLGLSHFEWYVGEYYDERLVLFDNGFYPFAWGTALLLIGQLARFHYRVLAMLIAESVAIAVLLWKRSTVPAPLADHALFPDTTLLNELIVIAIVIAGLALADAYMARVIRKILRRDR